MAVNGIRKEYTEVLENRKGESVIKRNWILACKKMEKETLREQVNKRKRNQEK